MTRPEELFLFGGSSPWSPDDWTASDDRVRGGSSQSYLTISHPSTADPSTANFHGTLDITTLGGAGFASQRTTSTTRSWDLSAYEGVKLDIQRGDGKMYTFIVKDEVLPPSEGGREQAGISWEYDFRVGKVGGGSEDGEGNGGNEDGGKMAWIPWSEFKATYRGREKKDAPPLDLSGVKRFSLMMRSFFGTQEGEFSLVLNSVSAVRKIEEGRNRAKSSSAVFPKPYKDEYDESYDDKVDEKRNVLNQTGAGDGQRDAGILSCLSSLCIIS